MSDTQRTRAALITLLADNVTGQISAQDLRDFLVTVMDTEFVNPGDFWKKPHPDGLTTDKLVRGWIDYSQEAGSAISFADVIYLSPTSGVWYRADVSDSTMGPGIGLAADSYASGATTMQVLRRGLVNDSAFSARFSGNIGRPLYLASGSPGSMSVTITTDSVYRVGLVENHSDGATSVFIRFDPEWAVKGA
jgi:hypothetical protein